MDTTDALAAEHARLLTRLAELSLAVAGDVQAAVSACEDTDQMIRLADSFARVGRCMRMSIALSMRLERGEPLSVDHHDRGTVETERDESRVIEERPERLERETLLERENLFDRLPAGDLGSQIASVARSLSTAARALPAPMARARCAEIAAITGGPPQHWLREANCNRPSPGPVAILGHPRGPPRRLN